MSASQTPAHRYPSSDGGRRQRPDTIDMTDRDVAAEDDTLHVDDRVERLKGESEESQWGTITGRVADAGDDWLVVDNSGVTHRDNAAQLCRARRGHARR